jgi:sugar phosphate isomerase/epimerase
MSDLRPLGLQLYSVREAMAKDFVKTITHVANTGYLGVETASLPPGVTPHQAKTLFNDLGLTIISAHSPLPLGDNKNQVLETLHTLGTNYLVCAWLSPEEYFSSLMGIRSACDLLNEANQVTQAAGMTLLYHNHWFEFQPVAGVLPYQVMNEQLDNSILWEIDLYWVQTAGQDAVQVLTELGSRVRLIHVKDGPCQLGQPMQALGTGVMNLPPMIQQTQAEWLIVEQDNSAGDVTQDIVTSYHYMVSTHLGRGR